MELPENIRKTLEGLRKNRKHYIDIKLIGGRCYVYESTSRWDSENRKVKKISKYIGKITVDGTFVESVPRRPELEAALIETSKKAHGVNAIRWDSGASAVNFGKYEKGILSKLSMDGRTPISEIGKLIGVGSTAAERQLSKIESKHGIKYIAEVDVEKLGFLTYLVFIKFERNKPSLAEIRKELGKEPNVHLVMMTYGKYDIIMYLVIPWSQGIKAQLFNFRSRILAKYDFRLFVVPFYLDYCFVPLKDGFFEVLKDKVWKRSAEKPRPAEGDILMREYAVLRELASNGREEFAKIDEKYGLPHGSARYTYYKLRDSGVIKRVTISMLGLNIKYIYVLMLQKINSIKFAEHRKGILNSIISDFQSSHTNKFALVGDIEMPEGVFFLLPVFNERDAVVVDEELKKVEGADVDGMIVTNVLAGTLCYRLFDNTHSNQYKILKEEYNYK